MTTAPRWLDDEEQRAWRAFLIGSALIQAKIDEAAKRHDISGSEYAVLVRLSEAGGELRMAQLAEGLIHSRSRVTHTIKRMETQGLVARRDSSDDGRGVVAQLTDAGRGKLVEAAPDHVEAVRRHLFDLASREEILALGRVMAAVADDLHELAPEANRIR